MAKSKPRPRPVTTLVTNHKSEQGKENWQETSQDHNRQVIPPQHSSLVPVTREDPYQSSSFFRYTFL